MKDEVKHRVGKIKMRGVMETAERERLVVVVMTFPNCELVLHFYFNLGGFACVMLF